LKRNLQEKVISGVKVEKEKVLKHTRVYKGENTVEETIQASR